MSARCSLTTVAIASLLTAGCAVGPDYRRPEPRVAAAWMEPVALGEVDTAWWRAFGDAGLDALIDRAIASAPDVREARARLAEARANRDAARGGRLPIAQAGGSATRNRLSENGQIPIGNIPAFSRDFSLFDIGFDAAWEIDLWGGQRRRAEAAAARADAALWGRRDAMLMLVAEVARSYVDLRAAQADLAVAEEGLAAQTELARLVGLRFAAGEAARGDADRADAQRAGAEAARDRMAAQASAAAYRIAALLGVPPEDIVPGLRAAGPIPAPPATIVSGVRSDLLERRPDVRQAERALAAATADIGAAKADLFPRFSLMGGIGQQARDTGDLTSGTSTRFSVGPSFSWPIFAGGRIRAQARAAGARADGAAARYDKAVAGALADSESAANRFANATSAATAARAALARESSAFDLAHLRADRGEDDRIALMRARIALAAARQDDHDAARARAEAAIALYKALGGGWRDQ